MTLPYNKFDIEPFRRAEIIASVLEAIARTERVRVRQLRAVREHANADRLDLSIAEWEVEAEQMRAEIEALKYDAWLLSHRRAA